MNEYNKKPNPSLIDLEKYEHELYYFKGKGIIPPPPPPIPELYLGDWSEEETRMMRDNRKSAHKIYNQVTSP